MYTRGSLAPRMHAVRGDGRRVFSGDTNQTTSSHVHTYTVVHIAHIAIVTRRAASSGLRVGTPIDRHQAVNTASVGTASLETRGYTSTGVQQPPVAQACFTQDSKAGMLTPMQCGAELPSRTVNTSTVTSAHMDVSYGCSSRGLEETPPPVLSGNFNADTRRMDRGMSELHDD